MNSELPMLTENQIDRFRTHFELMHAPRPHFFERVYKYSIEDCDGNFTTEDFFNFFYVENESIANCYKEIIKNIKNHKQFHTLHSYGQNGKSTFLQYFKHKANNDVSHELEIETIFFDFRERYKHTGREYDDSYYNRCCGFFERYFFGFSPETVDDHLNVIGEFIKFIQSIRNDLIQDHYPKGLENFFGVYVDHLQEIIENFIQNKEGKYFIPRKNAFREEVRSYLKQKEGEIPPSDLFCFIVFFRIFKNKRFFENNKSISGKRNKIVFVLDNIDDIKSHLAETIATYQIDFLAIYFLELNKIIQEKIEGLIPGLYLKTDIVFIFSYRTANYLNAIYANKNHLNPSTRERYPQVFSNTNKYKISTVKSSYEILQRRMHFYNEMCKAHNRVTDSNYSLMISLLRSVSPDLAEYDKGFVLKEKQNEIIDLPNIFRLWNGNRKVLFDIVDYPFTVDLFNTAESIPLEHSYLRKGAFFYLSLFVLNNKRYYTQLGRLISFIFTNHTDNICKKRANLLRLFLTFIIGLNDSITIKDRKIKNIEDVLEKGVDFSSIMKKVATLKRSTKEYVYVKQDFIELFEFMFFDEIDEWSHLISCYKGTTFIDDQGIEKAGKKFQFTNELELFFKYYNFERSEYTNKVIEDKLKRVKFYYNDNSKYFITHVIMHFEFYSLSAGNDKPLFLYNYTIPVKDKELDFSFRTPINKVIDRVTQCTDSLTDFIIDSVGQRYSLNDFATNSHFCLNGKFFFADLISKHITYIEQFRRSLLEEKLKISSLQTAPEEIKTDFLIKANSILTDNIKKYLNLFFRSYRKLYDPTQSMPSTLTDTYKGFRFLETQVTLIIESKYRNFNIKISIEHTKI